MSRMNMIKHPSALDTEKEVPYCLMATGVDAILM